MGKVKKKKDKRDWRYYILILIVILGVRVCQYSTLQDKEMDKMEEKIEQKKMEQIDPHKKDDR